MSTLKSTTKIQNKKEVISKTFMKMLNQYYKEKKIKQKEEKLKQQ